MALTLKQKLFITHYLATLNASEAARLAGYSEKTAHVMGRENMQKPAIQAAVADAMAARAEKLSYTAEDVLRRHVEIDQLDAADILTDAGDLLPIKQWPKPWRTTISGFDIATLGSGDTAAVLKKVKLPDKLRNLELLGKHVNVKAYVTEQAANTDASVADALRDLIVGLPD